MTNILMDSFSFRGYSIGTMCIYIETIVVCYIKNTITTAPPDTIARGQFL